MFSKYSTVPDLVITVPAVLLLSLGILVIYSSDPKLALQQALFALVGLVIYWLCSIMDFSAYQKLIDYLYYVILILLVIVLGIGFETRGSVRWIPLGLLNLQPSELAKPVLILFLAKFWSVRLPSWQNIGKSLLWVLPMLILIFRQPDLGTTLTILMIWILMLVAANVSLLKFVVMTGGMVIIAPMIWFFMKDYQRVRLLGFLSPDKDPLGIGYNVIQATIAVGSGEILGRGLGRGTQSRLQFLPEYRTDFIFASIAEEFGFIGSIIVLFLYGLVIFRSLSLVRLADRFSSLLIMGVLGMLFFQIVVNMGMNVGIVPITGITLPLISYGGSSLLATMISLGFIASTSRTIRLNKLN
ncbi:rod shape-determining protein RodA [Patescibacteria group bacterium]|nr:rod shape-determining protein RodA [Patescibacteria group bacterium]MCL5410111.1 rod shape-determining protein RodA [Patescibacteria group bacterium]